MRSCQEDDSFPSSFDAELLEPAGLSLVDKGGDSLDGGVLVQVVPLAVGEERRSPLAYPV